MKKKLLLLLCLLMAFTMSFGLAGCGSSTKTNQNMVIGVSKSMDSQNPMMAWNEVSWEVNNLIYDPLVRPNAELQPTPCLAKSWDISKDQKTWTFHLVTTNWSDGQPFTSQDVKWTYKTMMGNEALGYMYRDYLDGITKIACPDTHTVVITTSKPKANMLQCLSPILPKHIWSKMSDAKIETWANSKPVGTGPFTFKGSTDNSVTLTRNDNYFGTKPKIQNLTFATYQSSESMASALKTGEIDATNTVDAPQIASLQAQKNLSVIEGQVKGFTQMGINVYPTGKGNPLLRDKSIRQAMEYAIDKEKAIKMFYGNAGTVGTTLINPGDPFHYQPTPSEMRNYDPAKANALLDKAGYTKKDKNGIREAANGKKLSFTLVNISDNTPEIKFGQMIKADCKAVGININCTTMDSGALTDAVAAYKYDMFIWGWGGDIDPTVILGILTKAQLNNSNETGWVNAKYESLFKEQQTLMNVKDRIAAVKEMQKLVYDDAPYIILVYDDYIQAYRSDRWTNIKQIPANGCYFMNITDVNYITATPK